ncbi:MAG: neutral/alkaline non-lysosomal ceramidase N-terminal domain-containing protein [Candidatus Hydrogenedentes bacterium]|nr:neutral/alkaline non-lysosomal ceramidase N-terminal domain-containing protein [Candidatus Hydrogenedentota bacterium]
MKPAKNTFGVAAADITPPVGVTLMGYDPRPSESIGHPLRAEALACAGETGGWILISADVCAFASRLTCRLREDIARDTGLPPAAVMLTATHTHSGPHVTDAFWCERSELESAYFRTLRDRLRDVANRAWNARSPGTLVHTQTAAPELGCNRRVQNADGTWSNEWNDPSGRHTGYCDPAVDVAGVRREDGTVDVLLVNFGCHPVCFGPQSRAISGDYVSYLKDDLEARGDARTVMFTVSGHANIDPRDCVQGDPRVVQEMGEMLASHVRGSLSSLVPVDGTGVAAIEEPWQFDTTWTLEGRVRIYFPHADRGCRVNTGVSALAAGSLVLLGLPGETVSEYRRCFRRRSPFAHTILVSLANDFIGYLPTDAILKQGAYEAALSPLNPMEDALTARVDAALKRVHTAVHREPLADMPSENRLAEGPSDMH